MRLLHISFFHDGAGGFRKGFDVALQGLLHHDQLDVAAVVLALPHVGGGAVLGQRRTHAAQHMARLVRGHAVHTELLTKVLFKNLGHLLAWVKGANFVEYHFGIPVSVDI